MDRNRAASNIGAGLLAASVALGVFGLCFSLALTIGAPLGGRILSQYGANWLWGLCAITALVAVAGYAAIFQAVSQRQAKLRQRAAVPLGELCDCSQAG